MDTVVKPCMLGDWAVSGSGLTRILIPIFHLREVKEKTSGCKRSKNTKKKKNRKHEGCTYFVAWGDIDKDYRVGFS